MTSRDAWNFIGGRQVGARSGQTLPNLAPATGQLLGTFPDSGPEDVDLAVQAARAALHGPWGRTSAAERADLMDALADELSRCADEVAELESLDTGKPISLARSLDIPRSIANFRFFAGQVRHQSNPSHEMADAINLTLRRPLGVVALITPWNLPLYLLTWKVAPALATGNAVVAKPSELTPLTASWLGGALQRIGLPEGAFNLVQGLGSRVGDALVGHPQVQGVSFTGGTTTGARVGALAGGTFKKLSLELGGKNPTLVFADADLDAALDGAVRAAFSNQGQICLCGSRLLVQASIAEAFVDRLVERVQELRPGPPGDPQTRFGALISAAHRDKVAGYVALARSLGGQVRCGGQAPDLPAELAGGAWYLPTVITGLSPRCAPATEEIFGPVLTVHPFETEEEALAIANGVPYGLAASIWTRDLQRAHRLGARIEAGIIWINCWMKRDLRTPFGGVKHSGVGREGGDWSLDFYTEARNLCFQL